MKFEIVLPIFVVIIANVLYQISSKSIATDQNAFMGLVVNYGTALISSAILFCLTPHNTTLTELSRTNWACILMGLSITAVEAGFIYIYRMGGQISTVSLIVNILLSIALLIVGVSIYHETLTLTKIIGVVFCAVGIIFISL